jgi:hypothetical protein
LVIGEPHRESIGLLIRLINDIHKLQEHALIGGVSQPELGHSLLLQPVLLVSADCEIDQERYSDDRDGGDQSPGAHECKGAAHSVAEARRNVPRNALSGNAPLKPVPQQARLAGAFGGDAALERQPTLEGC